MNQLTKLLIVIIYLTTLTNSAYLSFYIERSPNSEYDYIHLFFNPDPTADDYKVVYQIPKMNNENKFKIRLCPENYTDSNQCKEDRLKTIAYIDPKDIQSLYQINIKDKYKLCGFGLGFFEAQDSFLKLVNPENPKTFDDNVSANPELLFKEPALIMAYIKLADKMKYSEYLNFKEKVSKCQLDFNVSELRPFEFSHKQIRFVQEEKINVLELFYTNNNVFNFNDGISPSISNYKMYFEQYEQYDINKKKNLKPATNSPNKMDTQEVERTLRFDIKNNKLRILTESNGCIIPKDDVGKKREVNEIDLTNKNEEMVFVPMICSNKNENSEAKISALNSEKCEIVNSSSKFIIKNNKVYKDGKELNETFDLKETVIESQISRQEGDFKNYFYHHCGLMEFCDAIYDSENKVLYLRCFQKDLIVKKNSKNEIINTFEVRKDNKNNQEKEISFNSNLDRRRLLTIYKMPKAAYFFLLGTIFACITIWAFFLLTIPGILLTVVCVFATGICCFMGSINKEYEDAVGEQLDFDTEKIKKNYQKNKNKRYRRRLLASSSDIIKKSTKEELITLKNNIINAKDQLIQKLNAFRIENKKTDPSYKNSIMFYTKIGETAADYKNSIIPELDRWTLEEEKNFNFSEDILEGTDENKKESGGLRMPKNNIGGNNHLVFQVPQIPNLNNIAKKGDGSEKNIYDGSVNMWNIQRVKKRKMDFSTGEVMSGQNKNENFEDMADFEEDESNQSMNSIMGNIQTVDVKKIKIKLII